jgi:hypothetical protein
MRIFVPPLPLRGAFLGSVRVRVHFTWAPRPRVAAVRCGFVYGLLSGVTVLFFPFPSPLSFLLFPALWIWIWIWVRRLEALQRCCYIHGRGGGRWLCITPSHLSALLLCSGVACRGVVYGTTTITITIMLLIITYAISAICLEEVLGTHAGVATSLSLSHVRSPFIHCAFIV